ncbi:hypothetical protein [Embleya sp. NPDC059259]|uniref:hypothetical protein n=1 Tax=unclassified Embleya TaxID=2699296 RepID=UPI003688069A
MPRSRKDFHQTPLESATRCDAHIRRFRVAVAQDAVDHIDAEPARAALRMMRRTMHADVRPWCRLDLGALPASASHGAM